MSILNIGGSTKPDGLINIGGSGVSINLTAPAIASNTTIITACAGIDQNQNPVNVCFGTQSVANVTLAAAAYNVQQALPANADTTIAIPSGYLRCTLAADGATSVVLGNRTGGLAATLPVTFGVTGSSLVLGNAGGSSVSVTIIWS